MKNLASKLVKVMNETQRVAKNGNNTFHGYKYATEADVSEAVREVLVKYNVFIFSSVVMSHKEGDLTSVQMEHTIVDGDSGELYKVLSMGQGQDKGDKGANKAITAATKYFMMKCFLIPTGDDPEATDENGKSTGPKTLAVAKTTKASEDKTDAPPKKYGFSGKPQVKTEVKGDASGFGN